MAASIHARNDRKARITVSPHRYNGHLPPLILLVRLDLLHLANVCNLACACVSLAYVLGQEGLARRVL